MKNKILTYLFFILPAFSIAQNQDSIVFKNKIIDYSIDATGSLFLSFEGGSITKYSPTLDSLFTYSPLKVGNTKLLESGTGLVIFAFYEFFQEYLLTNRFLSSPNRTKLSNSSIDYIDLATQSSDNNIWLLESSNFRLIKYNVILKRIEFETSLNTIINSSDNNFTFIKEYQNQVYLVDENSGIYVFDNLGNFSKFITAKTNKFTFEKNDIIYLEDGKMVKLDIYSNSINRTPLSEKNVLGIMKYKFNLYLVKNKSLIRHF